MAAGDAAASVNPAALSGIRFLVSKRIEELEAAGGRHEHRLSVASQAGLELRERLQGAQERWEHIMAHLASFEAGDIEASFQTLAALRVDVATLDERFRDDGDRLADIRGEQEVLRSVYRSLDDLASANGTSPATSATRLRNASRQVFQIIEEERMRIARDMHDGPAQSMANLVLQAEILERLMDREPKLVARELVDFKNGVRRVLDDTRRLIFDLRPMTLDDLGLVPTLRKFLRDYHEKTGITTHLRVTGEEVRLPETYEPTLFRICQEALNNVRKHADAQTVEVAIVFAPGSVVAVVKDDGRGFDVAATEALLDSSTHLGLISMRERADLEKGNLHVRSEAGQGTEIRAAFDW